MTPALWAAISHEVREQTDAEISSEPPTIRSVSGGCIHRAWEVSSASQRWFVKTNAEGTIAMFEAEHAGLSMIEQTRSIRVPLPLACGTTEGTAWLVMEWLPLRSGTPTAFHEMGRQLARFHRQVEPGRFHGWSRSNFIGTTPQSNAPHRSWASFFREERLGPQFDLAGSRFVNAAAVMELVPTLLDSHDPEASPLHGDLWSGNAAFSHEGEPVIFDPAFYHGDRETDLAFTTMFGGFPSSFYEGYDAEWPRADGFCRRIQLYNLYHELNHHHLFGEPYGLQADRTISALLKEAELRFG